MTGRDSFESWGAKINAQKQKSRLETLVLEKDERDDVEQDDAELEMQRLVRVAIVDECCTDLVSTAAVIEAEPDLTVVGTGTSTAEVLEVEHDFCPQVIMLDLEDPEVIGQEVTSSAARQDEHPQLLILMEKTNETAAIAALNAGAAAVCTKSDPYDVVVQSVRNIATGRGPAISPTLLEIFVRRLSRKRPSHSVDASPALHLCTSREIEVLRVLAEGATNAEIGRRLFISQATVRTHIQNLRLKLNARNRVGLVVLAHESDLFSQVVTAAD